MPKRAVLVLLALGACQPATEREDRTGAAPATAVPAEGLHQGLLYGRITTSDGAVHRGRLRWGGDQEALWGNYFNGVKKGTAWIGQLPAERVPRDRLSVEVLGINVPLWSREADLSRPFMARFGDVTRIEALGRAHRERRLHRPPPMGPGGMPGLRPAPGPAVRYHPLDRPSDG
jgi:hypothetical protein